jgi:hypothetical protein
MGAKANGRFHIKISEITQTTLNPAGWFFCAGTLVMPSTETVTNRKECRILLSVINRV